MSSASPLPPARLPPAQLPPARLHPDAGTPLRRLLAPLNIAAYITWLAIAASALVPHRFDSTPRIWLGAAALLLILGLFVASALRPAHDARWPARLALAQGLCVVLAEAALRNGQVAVLMIIVAGQLAVLLPVRAAALWLLAFNAAIGAQWLLRSDFDWNLVLGWLLPVCGFQAFAALTGHYAGSSESARRHLEQVNAELLATRRLLEESARAGERLKLSRELHDVAGHTLTALKLNLAGLARDPTLAAREELRTAATLADELLGQIRQVVSALRDHDGMDLGAALDALARPLPGTRIAVQVEDGLRVDDLPRAEALLRCAQEAITNAVRHGRASWIEIALSRSAGALLLRVENNGATPARIVEGNGLTGMRERLHALGGSLELAPTPPRGLRLLVRLPEARDIAAIDSGIARSDIAGGDGSEAQT